MDYNDKLSRLYAALVNGQVNAPDEGGIFDNRVADFENILKNAATNNLLPEQVYGMVENTPSLNAILSNHPVVKGEQPLEILLQQIQQGTEDLAKNPENVNLGLNSLNNAMKNPSLKEQFNWIHDPNPDYIVRSPGDDLIKHVTKPGFDFEPITNSVKDAILAGTSAAAAGNLLQNPNLKAWFAKNTSKVLPNIGSTALKLLK